MRSRKFWKINENNFPLAARVGDDRAGKVGPDHRPAGRKPEARPAKTTNAELRNVEKPKGRAFGELKYYEKTICY